MKNQYINALIFTVIACLLLPFAALPGGVDNTEFKDIKKQTEKFEIYITAEDKIESVNALDYVVGVLFAEISPEYNAEAIKAQAVAAYTYALYQKNLSDEKYDLSDDANRHQGYLSEDAARKKFGDKYDAYRKIFFDAAKQVEGQVITYGGEPILAAYHAVSSGKTESGAVAFSEDYPYLAPQDSIGDLLSPIYFSTKEVESGEFFEKLEKYGVKECENVIGESERSESGTVLNMEICGVSFTGGHMREIFGLKSANFDLAYDENGAYIFTVRGSGHGAGMSQYGANYMASLGSTYKEILEWYYRDTEINK